MPSLLRMVAEMGLNIGPFQRGLDKAKVAAAQGAENIGRTFATTIARYFGTAALIGFGAAMVRRIGEIKDMAEQFNLTTDEVQKFGQAFEDSGLKMQDAGAAMDRLNRSRKEAVESSLELRKSFAEFGIDLKDLNDSGIKTADIFQRIGVALKEGVGDRERAALMELMGRSGARFAEAMKELSTIKPVIIDEAEIKRVEEAEKLLRRIRREIENMAVVGTAKIIDDFSGETDRKRAAQAAEAQAIAKGAVQRGIGSLFRLIGGGGKAPEAAAEAKPLFEDKIALKERGASLEAQAKLEERLSAIAFGRLRSDEQTASLRKDQQAIEAEIARQKELQTHGLYTEERFAQIIAELKLKQLDAEEKILAIQKQRKGIDLIGLSRSVGSANPAQFAPPVGDNRPAGLPGMGKAVEILGRIEEGLKGRRVVLGR